MVVSPVVTLDMWLHEHPRGRINCQSPVGSVAGRLVISLGGGSGGGSVGVGIVFYVFDARGVLRAVLGIPYVIFTEDGIPDGVVTSRAGIFLWVGIFSLHLGKGPPRGRT